MGWTWSDMDVRPREHNMEREKKATYPVVYEVMNKDCNLPVQSLPNVPICPCFLASKKKHWKNGEIFMTFSQEQTDSWDTHNEALEMHLRSLKLEWIYINK